MFTARVSIIVPAYAHAQFIGDAIRSVINQTLADWELIIVNDGSQDNTRDVIKPFLSDCRIRYYEQKNQGQSVARNVGISKSRGKYIHFLDDDDWLPSNALDWQLSTLTTCPDVAVIVGSVTYVTETGTSVSLPRIKEGKISFLDLFGGNAYASPGQALFRREVFDQVGLFDVSLPGVDDYDMLFKVARSLHILSTNRNALFYRCHQNNASSNRVQMLENGLKVIGRHLGSVPVGRERRQAKRIGMRYQYRYAGSVLLANAISGTHQKVDVRQRPILIPLAKYFWLALLSDPILMKNIFLDTLRGYKRRCFPKWRVVEPFK